MDAPPVSPTPWQRLPADLATTMRPRLPASVPALADAVAQATPAFAAVEDAKFRRDLHTGVRVALERFLDLLGTGEPALPPRVREVFVALGAAEAREHRGPEALLAALRTAARLLLRLASESLAQVRPVDAAVLIDLSDAVTAYIDELAGASTDGYARQLREQAGESDRRRRLAELLLRGGAPVSVVAAAAAGAGWPAPGVVVPVILPLDQARDARFRFGGEGVVAERGRDAVLLLPEGPRTDRPRLAEALRGRGAVVGPALGWAEMPEAVRLTELAATLADALAGEAAPADAGGKAAHAGGASEPAHSGAAGHGGGASADPGGPVFADDHLATLALRGEPAALAALATRRLAPLAGLPQAQRERLLATLHSWLRHWGSRAAVAAELFVHPQTVSYRLRRLRELLGADLDDPAARFELLLVLTGTVQSSVSPASGSAPVHATGRAGRCGRAR